MSKPKKANYIPVEKSDPAWKILEKAMKWHEDLKPARIALAWRKELKEDHDGIIELGKCNKVSSLNHEYINFDYIISLNQERWDVLDDKQRLALVDHELCHASPDLDEDSIQKSDERGRKCWRRRKHTIEEFHEIVQRHGLWKDDLQRFADMILEKRKAGTLFDQVIQTTADQINAGALDKDGIKVRAEVRKAS